MAVSLVLVSRWRQRACVEGSPVMAQIMARQAQVDAAPPALTTQKPRMAYPDRSQLPSDPNAPAVSRWPWIPTAIAGGSR